MAGNHDSQTVGRQIATQGSTPSLAALPDSLLHFDNLPDAANVRQPVVEVLFGISGPTVWRWTKAGRLPKPRKQSERVTTWNVGDLRRALAAAE